MADFVVDTNVWVIAVKSLGSATVDELDCIERAATWLRQFVEGSDVLVIDWHYQIAAEYRRNIPKGSLSEQWLNRLYSSRERRIVEVDINLDQDHVPILPDTLNIPDRNDRKFVAVALARSPIPTLINATDSDWQDVSSTLHEHGILVRELCLDNRFSAGDRS